MGSRRGVGRTEVLVGVAVVVILGLVTIPLWMGTSRKAKRAEVPLIVDDIALAERTNKKAFDAYVSAEASPRALTAVNGDQVPWNPSAGFTKLHYDPPQDHSELWGAYQVVADEDGFKVTGTCDVDGDGQRARYEATESSDATAVSEASVY